MTVLYIVGYKLKSISLIRAYESQNGVSQSFRKNETNFVHYERAPRSMNGQNVVRCNYEFASQSTAHGVDNPIVGKAVVTFSK